MPRPIVGGAAVVLGPGAAAGLSLLLSLEHKPGVATIYVVMVALVTLLAGPAFGPAFGLASAALSLLPLIYFSLNSPHAFALHSSQIASLVTFAVGSAVVVYVVSREQRSRALTVGARELSDALAQARTAAWTWDVDGDRLHWSGDTKEIFGPGWTRDPTRFEQLVELIHPDDRPGFVAAVEGGLAAGYGFEAEVRTALSPDGRDWILLQGHARRELGRGARVAGFARDVTSRRHAEERERFLAALTKTLAASLDYEQMLAELARLAVPDLGDWCSIDVLDDDGAISSVAVAHAEPAKVELVGQLRRRFPPVADAPRGVAAVLRSGESELYTEIPDELLVEACRSEEELEAVRGLGLRSAIVAALKAHGRTLAALTLVTAETPRRYGLDDLAFAEEVAQRAALLIDNAGLHRDEQEARARAEHTARRMERLQALTGRLSAAAAPIEVAQTLVEESRDVVGARAGWASALTDDGSELRLLASSGYRSDFVDRYRRIPAQSELAVAKAVRSGEPMWLESVESSAESHPELAEAGAATGGEALAVVPLVSGGRAFGFLALRFDGPREFTDEDRALIGAFVRQGAQSLERAQLYERERRARADAELHRGEVEFLAEVSKALGSTLEFDAMLDELLRLAVPRLADALSIFLLEDGQLLRRAASVHIDPAKTELMRELRGVCFDVEENPESPLARTLLELESVALNRLTPEVLDTLAHDDEQLRTLESLGMKAWHSMPLVVHGEAIGVLTLATVGEREFDERDFELGREFASRSALALANAKEFGEERRARAYAERVSERLGHLHRTTAALAQAVTVDEAAHIIATEGGAALGASAAAVQLLSDDESELELAAATGHLQHQLEQYGRIAMEQQLPMVEAVGTAQLLWFDSAAALATRYPDHAQLRRGMEAVGFVPLVGHKKPLGLLTLSFEHRRSLDHEDRALLSMLGHQCGQALERAQLYEREQEARRNAEDAGRRLHQLQTIVEAGLAARSVDELVQELLSHVRRLLGADQAAILLVDENADVLRVRSAVGIPAEKTEDVRVPIGRGIAGRIAATGKAVIIDDLSGEEVVSQYLRESSGSLVGAPLMVEGRVLGVMHVSSDRLAAFGEADLELLELAAERAALAFERTMIYEREHEIAVTLQQSVLPGRLPEIDRLEVAVRYFPGRSELEVGGDWYDVIALDEARAGVVVGDVVGKGVLAASAMAQLRNALRVYALEGLKPSSVLTRLNELAKTVGTPFATVVYMVIDHKSGTCRYASAGHPPPLLLRRGWPAVFLEGGRSTPVGVGLEGRYRQATVDLGPGDVLLLYTDGLVEGRTVPLDEGMERLREAVESGPEPLDELLDHLGEVMSVDTRQDDVALVAIRFLPVEILNLRLAADPASLAEMRRELRAWLSAAGVGEAEAHDILVACSEACSNAILHAADPPAPDFEVRGTRRNGEISLVVRDFGSWREPSTAGDRGYGLRLMEALMDDVEVATEEEGTEVRLRRRLAGERTS